jgi:tRNA(fMet)-specific endonuclease VapC
MNTKIVVDTSVWIEFFHNEDSPVSSHLKSLLRSGQVVMTGMILAEILQGIKSSNEVIMVKNSFESLPFIEINKKVWQQSGEISAALRRKGITIPLSDIIIACAALTESFELYTLDPHFEKIPCIKLHKPILKH